MVKYRDPIFVLILGTITFGIYPIYWLISTSLELKKLSVKAPDVWLLWLFLVPLLNIVVAIYYDWKYSLAVEDFSGLSAAQLHFDDSLFSRFDGSNAG